MDQLEQWIAQILGQERPLDVLRGPERVRIMAERLQLLPLPFALVTVAGTNGKGTTVAALSTIWARAGHRVGTYTSPHVWNIQERITYNTCPVAPRSIVAAFQAIQAVRGDMFLSYFEWCTLAAVYLHVARGVDVCILEVGLGGRLDAVNAFDPDLVILTSIDWDHMEILGDSLAAIAQEKAAVIRPNIPVVVARAAQHPVVCAAVQAAVGIYEGRDYQLTENRFTYQGTVVSPLPRLPCGSVGAACAAALAWEDRLPLPPGRARSAYLTQSLAWVRIRGRFECHPTADGVEIFDVAHNPGGVAWLCRQVSTYYGEGAVAVWAGLTDKDLQGMVEAARATIAVWHVGPLSGERAGSGAELVAALVAAGVQHYHVYPSIEAAYSGAARSKASVRVIFGSFRTVAVCLQQRALSRSV